MLDPRKVQIVARFELYEAVRSRLVPFVVALYAAGAAFGAWGFTKTMEAAEKAAREALAEASNVPPESLPPDLVREQALPRIAESIEDERLREVLLSMEPLAIFYGFVALQLVALLVLVISGGTHAGELQSGAARYTLFRVDRLTWAVGKTAGQAALLGLGLLVGALVAGLVGVALDESFKVATIPSLFRASFQAWIYGLAYLGIFSGVSLVAKTPLVARALSFAVLVFCGVGHTVASAVYLSTESPVAQALRWVFPGQYAPGLWYLDLSSYLTSVVALLAMGTAGFSLGIYLFKGRDA